MTFTWVLGSHTQREESETAVTTLLSSQTQFTIVTCQEQEIKLIDQLLCGFNIFKTYPQWLFNVFLLVKSYTSSIPGGHPKNC